MKKIFHVIDTISDRTGLIVGWLSVGLVLLVSFETALHVFHKSTLWEYETVGFMGATMYSLAFAYVMRHRLNVRVDVIYSHFSRRIQALIDTLGMVIAFFPVMGFVTYSAIKKAHNAFVIDEKSAVTGWYPPAAPIRTIIAAAFVLLLLQGAVLFVRDFYYLLRNKAYD
jgi:TRAP-type mannitol/chloroaromatic compound transport system permease small subunit